MNLLEQLGRRVLVLDGAMGTMLQERGLPAGACPDLWCLELPERVEDIHREYVAAGAQILETNTFGTTPVRLSHYGEESKVEAINVAAVRIARRAAEGRALVAASMGPLGALVEPLGDMPFQEAYDQFAAQARALAIAQPDFIIIETIADLNELRAAVMACRDFAPQIKRVVQITMDPGGRAFTGTDAEGAALVLQSVGADVVGMNCSVGPEQLVEATLAMSRVARVPISVVPNAGLPLLQLDGTTAFPMGPEEFAGYGPKLVAAGASIVGGCCGTTPEHIRLLRQAVDGMEVARRPGTGAHANVLGLASRTKTLFFTDWNLPVIIGERINPTGRKKLSADIHDGVFALVRKEAKGQVAAGAPMLDVNCGVPLIDEAAAMSRAVRVVQKAVDVPLCIDSPGVDVVEAGLQAYVGRALINSTSGEEEKLESVLPLAKKYGAAVIALTLDEGGLAAGAKERLRIARKIVDRAAQYGLRPQDVVIDCLCLTAGAQQSEAKETLKAIRMIKDELGCCTSLGISNISFGLPQRHFLNAQFMTMAVTMGLDMAIANPLDEGMMDAVRATRLFLNRDRNAQQYMAAMNGKVLVHTLEDARKQLGATVPADAAAGAAAPQAGTAPSGSPGAIKTKGAEPPEEPLWRKHFIAVLEGDGDGILPLVEQALERGDNPMALLKEALIPGIEEVGRLFGEGIYFLPQLMLSAGAMKKAFNRLKPELQKLKEGSTEIGTVVLATVQGDIHDIGKNIVAVLLENYGFKVIDLGRDVKNDVVMAEAQKHGADIVGLSALMTTTMPQMKRVIEMFAAGGFDCPVLVGGAATTRSFAEKIGAAGYGRDAQEAVSIALKVLKERRGEAVQA